MLFNNVFTTNYIILSLWFLYFNNLNFIYISLSLIGIYLDFLMVRRLLRTEPVLNHTFAVFISLILPVFHLYVFNFGEIPLLGIYLNDNIPLYYISFWLSLMSLLPYIIVRRLYT